MAICQACLRTGECVQPMTSNDLQAYQLFVAKPDNPLMILYICIFCRSFLRRVVKFIGQCRTSDVFIREILNNDTETTPKIQTNYLQISEPTYYYIGRNFDLDVKIIKTSASDDENNLQVTLTNENNGHDFDGDGNDLDTETTPQIQTINLNTIKTSASDDEEHLPFLFVNEINGDDFNNHNNDDTEQPMLPMVKIETDCFEDIARKRKRKNRQVKEGFSSRMVTETNEYTVIKLNNKQIREEMIEHSQSEKYKVLPYKCEKCVKGFNFEDVLDNHMEKHSQKNGQYQCELCEQYCPSRVSLRGHMKSHSTRYKCKLCNIIRMSRQHILEHYSLEHTASAALYKCPKCPHTSNKRTGIQRHIRLHATGDPFECDLCGKMYKTKESLRVHIMRHDDNKLYQCDICKNTFVYANQLAKHIRSVHERHDYYCVECDIVFKSMDNLKQHLQRARIHRVPSSYKYRCPDCDERFISEPTLATHRTAVHASAGLVCAHCSRSYSCGAALRAHTRRAHAPRYPARRLACPHCDRTFARKYVLRVHIRTHTGTQRPEKEMKSLQGNMLKSNTTNL